MRNEWMEIFSQEGYRFCKVKPEETGVFYKYYEEGFHLVMFIDGTNGYLPTMGQLQVMQERVQELFYHPVGRLQDFPEDEVQHGIAAADDESVIRFLADHKIRLNITPTSNILLGRVADMSMHPIGKLYRSGVDVTINSDDVLIFDSDVSKEYLRLYESQCLTAEELDNIRKNGLKPEFN